MIARGAAWALAVLLAVPLSMLSPAGGPGALGGVVAGAAALGYLAVTRLLLPLGEEQPRAVGMARKAILLAAIVLLLAADQLVHLPRIGGKALLALLAVPTGKRLLSSATRLGAASLGSVVLLAAGLVSLIVYNNAQAYVDLLAAAEIMLVTVATRRMIACGEEAASQLLGGAAARRGSRNSRRSS